ncbi:MAG TPA: DUF2905 family protein [Candidatus Nanoarchaeia archaeon]|nr:DUF2905 family protein [Candidatus Nanoarchaeia archaeon]
MEFWELFVFGGFFLIFIGVLLFAGFPIGRLPGDFSFGGENFKVYVPMATSLILSLLLTLFLWLFFRN